MITLVITERAAEALRAMAGSDLEMAAVAVCGVADGHGAPRLLLDEVYEVPPEAYLRQEPDALTVASIGYVPALRVAAERGRAALWVHTHPGGDPTPSERDARVDEELRALFADRTESGSYGSVVVSPADVPHGFVVSGRWWSGAAERPQPLTRIVVIGDRLAVAPAFGSSSNRPDAEGPVYDRQVRAFGGPVQAALGQLRVGVVGVGGTGSAVVEQLARLGVRDLLLVDPDRLSDSNVTRVYGSDPSQVDRDKVDIAAEHVLRIAPDADVQKVRGTVLERETARKLTGRDVVFGCTDDNAGRVVLARLAAYYCIPTIDMGVLLDSTDGTLRGIYGRVTTWTPGHGCLICRGRIDLARAAAETLPDDELQARQREGYAPELGAAEPAVVTFTTLTAAVAVNELLDRFVGYGPQPGRGEVLVRLHDREMGTSTVPPRPGHFCDRDGAAFASGDAEPLLGLTWTR